MTRVLVTGGTGFIGRFLCRALIESGREVIVALRSDTAVTEPACERVIVGDINSRTDWTAALQNVDVVIHAAARVHVLRETADGNAYTETNAHGAMQLARSAAQAGVGRLIYLSSVKVNGEETRGRPYAASDLPQPCDDYGKSKWLGEQFIQQVCASTALESVIVRPPLVYGPGVKANFLRLLRLVDKQWPLPLGAVNNSRSLVSVWNLVDLLTLVISHRAAPGKTWMVRDAEDLSTPDLIRRIGAVMGRRVRLLPVPVAALRLAGRLTGRNEIGRLCGSLTVDVEPTRTVLGWSAPWTVDQSLTRTVEWYMSEGRSLDS
jgi:nucleoside-diphosphate-sugar epimerase